MIIDLKTISQVPRSFDLSLDPGWWRSEPENDQILGLDGPLKAQITISRNGSKYLMDGSLSGSLDLRCDRCLETYQHQLAFDFSCSLVPVPDSDENELELSEEEMSSGFITGDQISLDEIVKEQIYLSLPMKSLCREDCSGLCPTCGVNLNIDKCTCWRDKGHPGFSKLKNLKLEGE